MEKQTYRITVINDDGLETTKTFRGTEDGAHQWIADNIPEATAGDENPVFIFNVEDPQVGGLNGYQKLGTIRSVVRRLHRDVKPGDLFLESDTRGNPTAAARMAGKIVEVTPEGRVILAWPTEDSRCSVHLLAVIPAPDWSRDSGVKWVILGDFFPTDTPIDWVKREATEAREYAGDFLPVS